MPTAPTSPRWPGRIKGFKKSIFIVLNHLLQVWVNDCHNRQVWVHHWTETKSFGTREILPRGLLLSHWCRCLSYKPGKIFWFILRMVLNDNFHPETLSPWFSPVSKDFYVRTHWASWLLQAQLVLDWLLLRCCLRLAFTGVFTILYSTSIMKIVTPNVLFQLKQLLGWDDWELLLCKDRGVSPDTW